MHRLGRLLVRAASLLVMLGLLAGLPAALAMVIGWPLPRRVPTDWVGWERILTGGFPDQAVINLLAVALWLVWAAFGYSLIGEVAAACRGRPARQVRMISPLQALAALLVAGMSAGPAVTVSAALVVPPAVVATVAPPAAAATASGHSAASVPYAQTTLPWLTVATGRQDRGPIAVTDLPGGARASTAAATTGLPRFALTAQSGPLTVAAGGHHYTVTVQRGDTLWDLAGAWLGDPHRWPEIYHLNADRYDQHGRMRHGDHIEPTWVLTLPAAATPPPGAAPTQQDPGSQQEPGSQAGPGACPSAAPSGSPTPAPDTSATASSHGASTASPGGDPDGVVGAPAGAAPSSSATASALPAPTSEPAPTGQPDGRAHRPPGVTLPGGSWLDLGLASAIVAAVALVWAHRRRRYTRRPLSPDLRLDDPQVAAMPPVVNQIRRRLRRATRRTPDQYGPRGIDLHDAWPHGTPGEDGWTPGIDDGDLDAGLDLLDQQPDDPDTADDDRDDPADDGIEDGDDHTDNPVPAPARDRDNGGHPRPAVPSLAHPLSSVWPPAGLGLTGAGAPAAARGFLTAALAAGGLDDPNERSWVVMPSATAATLLGAGAVTLPQTPRLTVTAGLEEALDLLEAQTLHRSRLVYTHEVETVTQLRAADPTEEPLPPMLLLADATTRHQRTRIAALLAQGQRLDIHGVLLGAWPDGNTVVVAADGTTSRADGDGSRHGGHPADAGRLAVLTPAETSDLLASLAESHTGAPRAPAPVEPAATIPSAAARPLQQDADRCVQAVRDATEPAGGPADELDTASSAVPQPVPVNPLAAGTDGAPMRTATDPMPTAAAVESGDVDSGGPTGDAPLAAVQADAPGTGDPGDAPPTRAETDADDTAAEPAEDVAEDESGPGQVEISVLGPVAILDVPPGPPPRKKSLEVLVYLAVHNGEASAEAILDDLMPDVPASKAPGRLYTYISDLRTVLRRTGGRGTYLTHPNQRYALNHDTVQVDLWRMRAAIRDAEITTDPAGRITALRRAVDTYGGHLAEGTDYEWIESYREAVRQQALDAYLALADALVDNPAEQVTVLEAAIRHNPYVEGLYRQAMRARAALGHLDAIRTLRRAVTRALGEIDAEPADETIALAEHLVAGLQRPGRRSDRRPAPRPGTGTSGGAAA